jgi:hypothetical protein
MAGGCGWGALAGGWGCGALAMKSWGALAVGAPAVGCGALAIMYEIVGAEGGAAAKMILGGGVGPTMTVDA